MATLWVAARWIALVAVLSTSCQGQKEQASLPEAPTPVKIAMTEYRFEYAQAGHPISGRRFAFRVRNVGKLDHEVAVVRVPDDLQGTIDEQLRSSDRRTVPLLFRLSTRRPGTTSIFAVDLPPGRYALMCFVRDADGQTHAQKGMSSDFRVD